MKTTTLKNYDLSIEDLMVLDHDGLCAQLDFIFNKIKVASYDVAFKKLKELLQAIEEHQLLVKSEKISLCEKLIPLAYRHNIFLELMRLLQKFSPEDFSRNCSNHLMSAFENYHFVTQQLIRTSVGPEIFTDHDHFYAIKRKLRTEIAFTDIDFDFVEKLKHQPIEDIPTNEKLCLLAVVHLEQKDVAARFLLKHEDNGLLKVRALSLLKMIAYEEMSSADILYLEGQKLQPLVKEFLEQDFYFNYVLRKLNVQDFFKKDHDSVYFHQNKCELVHYKTCEIGQNTIDLVSGILFYEEGKKNILTEHRCNLISLLVKSSNTGIHIESLTDQLFKGEFYHQQSTYLRLKNIISEINKIKIHTKRKNNRYYFDFERCPYGVITSIDSRTSGPLAYISRTHKTVNRRIIEKELSIKPSTASLYLKNWKDQNLVIKSPKNRFGEFEIANTQLS